MQGSTVWTRHRNRQNRHHALELHTGSPSEGETLRASVQKPAPDAMAYNAYIVEAVRTAGGRRGGRLSGWHPADIGGAICDALLERAGVDGVHVEDVAWGCVTQSGAHAENLGRNVVLSSKRLPDTVPAFTVDRQCGSAQQSLHLAAQAVMSGTQDW
eukprot:5420889-Prymnesium_polylepis.1